MTAKLVREFVYILLTGLLIQSCTRKDIDFGDDPENNYTSVAFTDTIGVELSTVMVDSFETSGASSLLVGKYKDPFLGIVSTKSFFQMTVPSATTDIPSSAQYDSVVFILYLNDYYYGDTNRVQTFYVNELSQAIAYSYNNKLYSTSDVPVKPTPLGSKSMRIRPVLDDSLVVKLNDTKGFELFNKLKLQSTDVTNSDEFLNYFKGVSLTTGVDDTTAVYGFIGTAIMRVYYHNTIPYPESKHTDFTLLTNNYSFTQILTNRAGTGLVSTGSNLTELPSSSTGNLAYTQPGTGLFLKMIFPSLKSIAGTEKLVRLLKAELIVRPTYLSFDRNKYKLPSQLSLSLTDATNVVGSQVTDSIGNAVQYATPVIDDLYGENNYYRFNITPYINQWMNSIGSEDDGFFVMPNTSSTNVNRLIVNNAVYAGGSSKLLLHLLIINK